jgi:hypothetical protein
MKLDLDRFNERVTEWAQTTVLDIRSTAGTMGVQHRPDSPSLSASVPQIKGFTRKRQGSIDRISIKFPRVLIYAQKGAGKGRGGRKGSKWVDRYGEQKTTSAGSMGRMGGGGRTEKPFINVVLDTDKGVNELATIAAEELGSAVINRMFLK